MKINKQSNIYTIIYIAILVSLVGAALSFTYMSLKDRQQANADAEKMKQILASVHITPAEGQASAEYKRYITDSFIINAQGIRQNGDAFDVNVALEVKKSADKRQLPVYVCDLGEKGLKYILPVYGAGLWGPIWGYVSVDADGSTIYGAYFSHQGETPGLGAEIEKASFADRFNEKRLFFDHKFIPVTVVKTGQQAHTGGDQVDGVTGGTITSKGVSAMLDDCLTPYKAFLSHLQNMHATATKK